MIPWISVVFVVISPFAFLILLMLLFISLKWVTGARKDGGDYQLCSIATLLKITSAFNKLFFLREHLVRKSMPSIMCQGYIRTRKHS
jgi:hypothetical protein